MEGSLESSVYINPDSQRSSMNIAGLVGCYRPDLTRDLNNQLSRSTFASLLEWVILFIYKQEHKGQIEDKHNSWNGYMGTFVSIARCYEGASNTMYTGWKTSDDDVESEYKTDWCGWAFDKATTRLSEARTCNVSKSSALKISRGWSQYCYWITRPKFQFANHFLQEQTDLQACNLEW